MALVGIVMTFVIFGEEPGGNSPTFPSIVAVGSCPDIVIIVVIFDWLGPEELWHYYWSASMCLILCLSGKMNQK